MIPPKRFDTFPLTGGCSGGLDAFRLFFEIFRSLYTVLVRFYPGSFRLFVQYVQLGLLGFAIHFIHFIIYFRHFRQKNTVS